MKANEWSERLFHFVLRHYPSFVSIKLIMSIFIYLIILIYALFRAVRGNIRTFCSTNWIILKQKEINKFEDAHDDHNKYCILIPVLREQEVINDAFRTFSSIKDNFELIFITTQKEDYQEKIRYEELLTLKD